MDLETDKQMSLTIAKILDGLPRLRVFDDELKAYEDNVTFNPVYPVIDKSTYLGIEIEIENVRTWQHPSPYWRSTEDGSLRNHGIEFITPPIRAWRVEHAITRLFSEINPEAEFTERTSIHVHMNIRTLTIEQLEALVITYLVFEKLMFDYVGEERSKNIFCVPLTETNNGLTIEKLITNKELHFPWSKYTALNLLPIRDKGTIEFRHMHGTKDIKKLMGWINLILCLKKFALKNTPEYIWKHVHSLNTSSQYELFTQEVFGEHADLLWKTTSPQEKIADCVSYIKDKCIRNTFRSTIIIEEGSPLYKYKYTLASSPWDRPVRQIRVSVDEGSDPPEGFTVTTPHPSFFFEDSPLWPGRNEPPTMPSVAEILRINAETQRRARQTTPASTTLNSLLNRI